MRSFDPSPASSPARKRQRLSSPTYDEQVGDLSQEDLEAFDALEARLSQHSQSSQRHCENGGQNGKVQRVKAIADALSFSESNAPRYDSQNTNFPFASGATSGLADDPDNPFTTGFATFRTSGADLSSPFAVGFATASSIAKVAQIPHDYERSPSPEQPKEQNLDSWFQPAPSIPTVAFQPASITITDPATLASGFVKASNKGLIVPSSAALAKARAKMKDIWGEANSDPMDPITTHSPDVMKGGDAENAFRMASNLPSSPQRPALRAVENSLNAPSTPTPLGFSRPSITAKPVISSPLADQIAKHNNPKPFKPPLLMQRAIGNRGTSSPLNPASQFSGIPAFTTAGSQHPLASTSLTIGAMKTGASGPAMLTTPARIVKHSRVGPRKDGPSPFVTPFKVGMKPGQPGRSQLEQSAMDIATLARSEKPKDSSLTKERSGGNAQTKGISKTKVFDLTIPPNRISLTLSGLQPQQYSAGEMEAMGIDITALSQINPVSAIYYSFHTATATPLTSSQAILLGPAAALNQLSGRGCTLATKPWVDNHWCLILWKLAGMVALDPERERFPMQKRWCWSEVMRQLLYRYERELQGGIRPPLRLIAAQDVPASCPMVLCISGITWSEEGLTDDGMPIVPHPELEVTDGWYRLRAQVDGPLARAIRRGVIRIGRKIRVVGARLSSERKDPSEVLEAYNSTKLVIYGNSSHIAPWHAKLGFQIGPCISTLHSLTADGGVISAMDLVVTKAHPIAFFEFIEDKHGKRHREGPLNESEENAANEKWKKKREAAEAKLHSEFDKKFHRYEEYVDRLERRAGAQFKASESDLPPDNIENLYDELEDPVDGGRVLASLTSNEAGWLARYISDRIEKERASAGDEIESELKDLCPPRDVRSFRVLVVQDSCTLRRSAHRKAQLTVWDVLQLALSEDYAAGTFAIGQRYLVTNLIPTQQGAWMNDEPGSEVYLCTRRESRWTTLKFK